MNRRYGIGWCVLGAVLLSALWAVSTPPPGAEGSDAWRAWGNFHPDEVSHISVVRWMAEHAGALPPYHWPYDTSVHPPLYHGFAALVFWLLRRVMDTDSALYGVRLVSALMGGGTVYFAYRAARATRLARNVALPAAALVALVPMRASLSGAVTNENLAALGAAGALAFLYEGARGGFPPRRLAGLIFWTTVAIGSKVTSIGLLLAVLCVFAFVARARGTGIARVAREMGLLLAALGAALGWWFVYNTRHFGDPLRKAAADRLWDGVQPGYAVLGPLRHFAPWRYLLSIGGNGWASFWGRFDGMRHGFPLPVYGLLFLLQLGAFAGLGPRLRRVLARSAPERAIGIATGIFAAWVALVYCQYNWAHYTPQGRYFFVLLAPFGILMAGGTDELLRRWVPARSARTGIWWGLGILLLALNLYALYVMPRFRPDALAGGVADPVQYAHVAYR